MKHTTRITIVMLILLVSACAPQAAPTTNPVDVQSTAAAAAFTIIAQTQAAVPTATPVPPTETPTQTPLPTVTPLPLPTLSTQEVLATGMPTFTPIPVQGSSNNQDPCNQTLTSWKGPTAELKIQYAYQPQSKDDEVVLSLWVSGERGECGFLANLSQGPAGQYTAGAFVNGKKDFKVFGGFRITAPGRWTIVIRNDSIVAQGGCYPDC